MKERQFDNKGFSLLEVLVAVIIIGIISVPLLRAFGTSAQTNAKAKSQMKASTAGENIMESIRNLNNDDLDELVEKYSTASGNTVCRTSSGIVFNIIDGTDFGAELPDGMTAKVEFRTDSYSNANSLNLAEFEAISVKNCAIYTMPSGFDEEAYNEIKDRNDNAVATDSTKSIINKSTIKETLKRTINITIEKVLDTDKLIDGDGNEVDHIKVWLEVSYVFDSSNYLLDAQKTYYPFGDDKKKTLLFDNKSSKETLENVYLFFYPRYSVKTKGKDVINIINESDIDTNIYLTAMGGGTDTGNQDYYKTSDLLSINVKEGSMQTKSGVASSDQKYGHVTIRTNMLSVSSVTGLRTPYSSKSGVDPNTYELCAELAYKTTGASAISGDSAEKTLQVSDIDGKKLYAEEVPTRIYKVVTTVYDASGNEIVEFDGTKLNKY